ncbi:MAG: pfkB family carbohydrate kinase [Rickettsiaceae bacterium]|jgi:sugar/nucleoside kinase (ribokinase family)|nr:pfkB family carbohydrate kinase [Rickettsiaceae bacterium]
MDKSYDIVGIGNAIIDIVCLVEESFLAEHNLTKGGMFLIGEADAQKLSHLKHQKIASGGSVANSIASLSMLGSRAALIGKTGRDKFGDIFFDDLKKIGCDFFCRHKEKDGATAKSFILVTPDGERTMCTYLGLASKIADEIDEKLIKNSKILYLEGYLWDEPETIAALRSAISIAKNNNVKTAFSLSDAFCVERHQAEFLEIIAQLDVLFANEMEMKLLVGENFADDDYKKVKEMIGRINSNLVLALTLGERGAIIFDGTKTVNQVNAMKVEKVADTTGAGDAFAAGFLFGMNKDIGLEKSAALGNNLAAEVIGQIGARIDQKRILEIVKS